MTLSNFSNYSQQFGSLLIVLLGVPFFSRRELPMRIIVFYGLNSFVFQLIGWVIFYSKSKAINLNGNLYTLAEALLLLSFFNSIFKSPSEKRAVIVMAAVYVVLYFAFMMDRWNELVSSTRTMRDLMVITCSVMYFFYLMREMPTNEITKYPALWIVAGMLCFFSGTFTLSLSLSYLVKVLHNDLSLIWSMRNFFRLIFCFVVCYGLWLDYKQLKNKFVVNLAR